MSNLFLNLNNEQKGPFGVDQVNQMLASGEATVETSAWMEGMEGWEPLSSDTFSALGVGAAAEQPSPEPAASPDPAPQTTDAQPQATAATQPSPGAEADGEAQKSEKDFVPTLLLCLFLGPLGVHRFYVGKNGSGVAMLLTCGGLGIWATVDLIMIAVGKFTDNQGLVVKS